jgi:hypothetical protein
MRVRQITRVVAAVAMAAAGLTVAVGAPSQAAPSSATAAAAEGCDGSQVRTCTSLQVSGHRFRPFANIKDVDGDANGNFRVDVIKVQVQVRLSTGAWIDYGPPIVDRPTGWHGLFDKIDPIAPWQSCDGNPRVFRAVALFRWDSFGSNYNDQWWPSPASTVRCNRG